MSEARNFFSNKSESKAPFVFEKGNMVRRKKRGFEIYDKKLESWIAVADVGRVIGRYRSRNAVTGLLTNFYEVKFGSDKKHKGEFAETDLEIFN